MGSLRLQQWLEPFEACQEDYATALTLDLGLRQSISGGVSPVVLVLKNLVTQGSDQLITQSGTTSQV